MAQKILFTSIKGGVGTSSCLLGLGLALAELGERVLLVDGDDKCGCLLTLCGCDGAQVYTLADVERKACRVKQAVMQHPTVRNLYVLPCLGCADERTAVLAVKELEASFDFVLCDDVSGELCDKVFVVAEPYVPALKCADETASLWKDRGNKNIFLCLNNVSGALLADGLLLSPEETAGLLHAPLAMVVPESPELPLGNVSKKCKAAYVRAAKKLLGKNVKEINLVRGYGGWNAKIKRWLRQSVT